MRALHVDPSQQSRRVSIRLKPFRAWRPDPAIADRVVSPPYDVVTRDEAVAFADGNPFSFLHIGRSDIDVPAHVDPYDDRVYWKARDNLNAFMTDGTLIRDREPSLYLYELTMLGRSQVGVVGCVHVADYAADVIKKHERTRPDKENDRTRHVLELNANAEPVFLAYTGQPILDRLNTAEMRRAPLYEIVTSDGVLHRVWRVSRAGEYLDVFRRIPEAYVADGHHRCASAWRAGERRRAANPAHTGDEEYNWFLAVLFPANQLEILPYHRVVRDLGDLTPSTFLKRLADVGRLTGTTTPIPDQPGSIDVYVAQSWYRLEFDPASIDVADPIKSLDTDLLSERVLQPVLGIDDIRTDPRVDFVGGIHGAAELRRRVDEGEAAVAFALHPVRMEQVMLVADGGGVMPPKSTWFEPKLASGLFVHTLD